MVDPEEPSQQVTRFLTKLRKFRETHGNPSIRDIGQMANYSQSSIGKVFHGNRLPTWSMVEAILRACIQIDGEEVSAVDLENWRAEHEAVRRHVQVNRVQQNIFQVGRDYTYLDGSNVVVGAANINTQSGIIHGQVHVSTAGDADSYMTEYLEEVEGEITLVARGARRRLLGYRVLRFAMLATSAVTPALALLEATPWITALVGATAFLAEGAIQLTRINDRAVLDTQRAAGLNREFRMYRTQVAHYASGDRFTLLVRRVEEIRQSNDNDRLSVVQQSFGSLGGQPDTRGIPALESNP